MMNYTSDFDLIEELWNEIDSAYKNRYYHNLEHLKFMLNELDDIKYKFTIKQINDIELAIFYHDIVYEFDAVDNEEKSANKAINCLLRCESIDLDTIREVNKMILATKNHYTEESYIEYFLDIDMLILASEPDVYVKYAENIRKEYWFYLEYEYNIGRKNVLKQMLKTPIFKSEYYRTRYETKAIENIKKELEAL